MPKPTTNNTTKTENSDKPEVVADTNKTKLTPKQPEQVKKAIALGKDMIKGMTSNPEITKASVARAMYPLIHDESREVIAQTFVEGAGLTEKGAMTYFYNTKRAVAKEAKAKSSTNPEA